MNTVDLKVSQTCHCALDVVLAPPSALATERGRAEGSGNKTSNGKSQEVRLANFYAKILFLLRAKIFQGQGLWGISLFCAISPLGTSKSTRAKISVDKLPA